jgi:hypothetical protein
MESSELSKSRREEKERREGKKLEQEKIATLSYFKRRRIL